MDRDDETLAFYGAEALAYTSRGQTPNQHFLDRFMAALPPGGAVLELGCGAGQDGEVMISRGFDVTMTDGTPDIAYAAATRLGRPVSTLLFEDLDEIEAFDGVWANACLLHVPRSALPRALSNVHAALKAGGFFYASFKAGVSEGRDPLGRYYNYPSQRWLTAVYDALNWDVLSMSTTEGGGYDGTPTQWLHVMATKSAKGGG